ncbi:MAG: PhzF family phenazine biosynthesis protein [Acidiferrobacter sp.]
MVKAALFQVDAFTTRLFSGNPAAVVALSAWPEGKVLQAIAAENNLSETAFFAPAASGFDLRWFTPLCEVDLCGHATLAAAHILFRHLAWPDPVIEFHTRSGDLTAWREGEWIVMDFPATDLTPCTTPPWLVAGLGIKPREVFVTARDYVAIYDDHKIVFAIRPDHEVLRALDRSGIAVSAPADGFGEGVDFVSRFFAPRLGVPEDPVTGSAHCALAPYWARRLAKSVLSARQLSSRGGEILCSVHGDRVALSGHAITFLTGEIEWEVDDPSA